MKSIGKELAANLVINTKRGRKEEKEERMVSGRQKSIQLNTLAVQAKPALALL